MALTNDDIGGLKKWTYEQMAGLAPDALLAQQQMQYPYSTSSTSHAGDSGTYVSGASFGPNNWPYMNDPAQLQQWDKRPFLDPYGVPQRQQGAPPPNIRAGALEELHKLLTGKTGLSSEDRSKIIEEIFNIGHGDTGRDGKVNSTTHEEYVEDEDDKMKRLVDDAVQSLS